MLVLIDRRYLVQIDCSSITYISEKQNGCLNEWVRKLELLFWFLESSPFSFYVFACTYGITCVVLYHLTFGFHFLGKLVLYTAETPYMTNDRISYNI